MRNLSPVRRRVGGIACMLLAALLLFARLSSPSMAMPGLANATDLVAAALQTICHAGPLDGGGADHGQLPGSDHGDCQLCPTCHLVGQLALPAPAGGVIPAPALTVIGLAAPLPPAMGPPGRPRLAAQPTGPPSSLV